MVPHAHGSADAGTSASRVATIQSPLLPGAVLPHSKLFQTDPKSHLLRASCHGKVHVSCSRTRVAEGLEADPLADELVLQLSVGILDKGIRHQHAESRKPQIIISEMQTRYLGAHLQKAQQEAVFLLLVVTLQTLENTGQPVLMLEGLQAIPAAAFPGSRWLVLTSRSSSTEALQLLASAN